MLEVFEKHLADIEISKRFEKAKTKEEKIAACTKYLEDNDFEVRIRGQYTQSNPAENVYGKIGAGGGKLSNHGTLTIDANVMNNLVIGSAGKILGDGLVNNTSKIDYLTAKFTMSELEQDMWSNKSKSEMDSYIMYNLVQQIAKEVGKKAMVVEHHDFATNEKHYAIKIGVVQ